MDLRRLRFPVLEMTPRAHGRPATEAKPSMHLGHGTGTRRGPASAAPPSRPAGQRVADVEKSPPGASPIRAASACSASCAALSPGAPTTIRPIEGPPPTRRLIRRTVPAMARAVRDGNGRQAPKGEQCRAQIRAGRTGGGGVVMAKIELGRVGAGSSTRARAGPPVGRGRAPNGDAQASRTHLDQPAGRLAGARPPGPGGAGGPSRAAGGARILAVVRIRENADDVRRAVRRHGGGATRARFGSSGLGGAHGPRPMRQR
jgi:hypothetical protein